MIVARGSTLTGTLASALIGALILALVGGGGCSSITQGMVVEDAALRRGFEFLEQEVRDWPGEKRCFSCHNNGDAARAVYLRMQLCGTAADPIAATSAWLTRPEEWKDNGTDGPFEDENLERLQFTAALIALDEARPGGRRGAVVHAARRLAADQDPSGSWQRTTGTVGIGSPITYGPTLATAIARHVLAHVDTHSHRVAIAKADAWLRQCPIRNVVEASGVLLGLGSATDADATRRRQDCLELLARAQHPKGGFGPYPNAAAEPFDTALVVVALAAAPKTEARRITMQRAVSWLRLQQETDGGWVETTRPAGQTSYAHRISTTGWVLQALLRHAARHHPPTIDGRIRLDRDPPR